MAAHLNKHAVYLTFSHNLELNYLEYGIEYIAQMTNGNFLGQRITVASERRRLG